MMMLPPRPGIDHTHSLQRIHEKVQREHEDTAEGTRTDMRGRRCEDQRGMRGSDRKRGGVGLHPNDDLREQGSGRGEKAQERRK